MDYSNHLFLLRQSLGDIYFAPKDQMPQMPELAKLVNTDLSRGFTVSQVAEKHAYPACPVAQADGTGVGPEDRTGGWTELMVWSVALEGKDDLERFKALKWGLRTWDLWSWNDCLPREIFTPLNRSVSSVLPGHVNDSEAYFTGATGALEMIFYVGRGVFSLDSPFTG